MVGEKWQCLSSVHVWPWCRPLRTGTNWHQLLLFMISLLLSLWSTISSSSNFIEISLSPSFYSNSLKSPSPPIPTRNHNPASFVIELYRDLSVYSFEPRFTPCIRAPSLSLLSTTDFALIRPRAQTSRSTISPCFAPRAPFSSCSFPTPSNQKPLTRDSIIFLNRTLNSGLALLFSPFFAPRLNVFFSRHE